MANQRKTLAEHLEFVESTARLSFFFAFRMKPRLPDETLEHILRLRMPLYHVALGLNPEVPVEPFQHFPDAGDAAGFEEEMWCQCREFIVERGRTFYPDSQGMGLRGIWQAECFKFDPPRPETPRRCVFHIGNAKAPDSIFSDSTYIAEHLLEMLNLAEREYSCTEVCTGTWLNSNPHWLKFFPQEWQLRMEERPEIPLWHLGYWGQIVTSKGLFNEKNGNYIREHDALRHRMRWSCSSLANLKKHLKGMLA